MADKILPGDVNPFTRPLAAFVVAQDKATGASSRTVEIMALTLERAIKLMLNHPGTGRVYKYAHNGRSHTASAPGEPPAPNYGRLLRSVGHGITGSVMRVGCFGYAKVPVALEFGTTTAGKNHNITIKPRPFMRPAWKSVERQMGGAVVASLRAEAATFNSKSP